MHRTALLYRVAISSLLAVLFSNHSYAQTDSARRILEHGEKVMRGMSAQSVMTMKIVRPDFTRELRLRAWTIGNKNALVEILKPTKEEGVVSLRRSEQMWNYLPKADQVVRVPTSLMLQSWMGSDFTNDDLMKASSLVRDYQHRILKKTKLYGESVVAIECRPKPGASVVWGKILYFARVQDFLPIAERYYDEDGALVRTVRLSHFKKMDDRTIPTRITIVPEGDKGNLTVVEYKKILFDRKIDTALFNKEGLRQTSQQAVALSSHWYLQPMPGAARRPAAPASARGKLVASLQ